MIGNGPARICAPAGIAAPATAAAAMPMVISPRNPVIAATPFFICLIHKQTGCPVLVNRLKQDEIRFAMDHTKPSRSAPRRKNDPAGVRSRILDAAFRLFQSQGFNATSVHEIMAAAGVSGGALHHHFPTKQALGEAVIDENVAAAVEDAWLGPVLNAANARDGILGVFEDLARELDEQGSVSGCPVNNLTLELAHANPAFRDQLKRQFDRWRQTIALKLGGPDAEARATMVIASYSGAMAMAKVEQRGEPLRTCAKELARLL
jgi:AcrR family transcriptional regulator